MRHVLLVASDGLDALEGEAICRHAPHSKAIRVICANMTDSLAPGQEVEAVYADSSPLLWEALDGSPLPSLVITISNSPIAVWAQLWAGEHSVPTLHHHAGTRSLNGVGYLRDRRGIALDAIADLLSFIDRSAQRHTRSFQPAATRVVGWPSMEYWFRITRNMNRETAGGCLVLTGPLHQAQYGLVNKILDACRHSCRQFTIHAGTAFRDMIVRTGLPLPDGFVLKPLSDAAGLAASVAGCRMLVTNDDRLQALSVVLGKPTAIIGLLPEIRSLQASAVRHIDIRAGDAARRIHDLWEEAPKLSFDPLEPAMNGGAAMCEWLKPYFV